MREWSVFSKMSLKRRNKTSKEASLFKPNTMHYFLSITALLFSLSGFTQTHCFVNDGLKVQTKVSFQIQNNEVSNGRWEVWDYGTDSTFVYPFKGVKIGSKLKISFPGKETPYQMPDPRHDNAWSFYPSKLLVPAIQLNYETNKWGMIPIPFERCPVEGK